MSDHDELTKRLRDPMEYLSPAIVKVGMEAADALEHWALSHDALVHEVERLTKERDEAQEWRWSLGEQLQTEIMLTNTLIREREDAHARAEKAEMARDAAIARAEAAEAELATYNTDGPTLHAAYRATREERDKLRALLREAGIIIADEDEPRMDKSELLARIAAATGDDNG